MKLSHAAFALLAIVAMVVAVIAGGRALGIGRGVETAAGLPAGKISVDDISIDDLPPEDTPAAPPPDTPSEAMADKPDSVPSPPSAGRRMIDPEIVAGPQDGAFERVEPRAPLSDLAQAQPPKPPKASMPDKWKGTPLFRPVATAAGLIEAKGYSVAVSGLDMVRPEETCGEAGRSWACGVSARTAFRAFLRGRAVVCTVPPEGGRDIISAECRIGKQDVGEWLVENGWARAAKGGPYEEAGKKAQAAKKGIFGAAPSLAGVPQAALIQLAEADAFRPAFGLARREGLWAIRGLRDEPLPLFAAVTAREAEIVPEIAEPVVSLRTMTAGSEVVEDYGHTGLSLRAHPVSSLRDDLRRVEIPRARADAERQRALHPFGSFGRQGIEQPVEQRERQVVHHFPAEVFQRLEHGRLARAGHAGDEQYLRGRGHEEIRRIASSILIGAEASNGLTAIAGTTRSARVHVAVSGMRSTRASSRTASATGARSKCGRSTMPTPRTSIRPAIVAGGRAISASPAPSRSV